MHVNHRYIFDDNSKYPIDIKYSEKEITGNDDVIINIDNKKTVIKGLKLKLTDEQKSRMHKRTNKISTIVEYAYLLQMGINVDPSMKELIINDEVVSIDTLKDESLYGFYIKEGVFYPPKFPDNYKPIIIQRTKKDSIELDCVRVVSEEDKRIVKFEIGRNKPISFIAYIDKEKKKVEYKYRFQLSKAKSVEDVIKHININNDLIDGKIFEHEIIGKKHDPKIYKTLLNLEQTLNIKFNVFYDELHESTINTINQINISLKEPIEINSNTVGFLMIDETDVDELNRIYNEQSDEQYTYILERDYKKYLLGQEIILKETLTLENARLSKLSDHKFIFDKADEDIEMRATSKLTQI